MAVLKRLQYLSVTSYHRLMGVYRVTATLFILCAFATANSGSHEINLADNDWTAAEVKQWGIQIDSALEDTQTAMRVTGKALSNQDFSGIGAGCARIGAAGAELTALAPGPTAELTEAVRGLADGTLSMARACRTIGPYSTEKDLDRFIAQTRLVGSYMDTIVELLTN